jgi:catalase
MTEPEKARLIASIAGNLGQVTRKDIIDRSIDHFRRADPDYGARLDQAVEALRAKR